MPSHRAFIALPVSEEIGVSISAVQSFLQSPGDGVRWESPDKFHITLKFLGTADFSLLERIARPLESIARMSPPFTLVYTGVGAFPSNRRPRVVWIGAEYNPVLAALQKAVEQACFDAGFPPEERSFHPHITLGRVKDENLDRRLTEAIKTCTFEPIHSRFSEIVLMKSELKHTGSIYTKLKSFSFQS
ncbi:MAG: RNA 2',3'-cyclic phosphodiesterase [Bacteroidota bacterium]